MTNSARTALAASLKGRTPTWTVAKLILELGLTGLNAQAQRQLEQLSKSASWTNQMSDDFDRFDVADTQLATFAKLFPALTVASGADADPAQLDLLTQQALRSILAGDTVPATAEAALVGQRYLKPAVGVSAAALRKRLRFLKNFEDKSRRLADVQRLRHAQMQAKSRLAYLVDADACDDATLAFCAYLAARANRRSVFQFDAQSRAQDQLSDALEQLLERSSSTNWAQVAMVKPTRKVIERIDLAGRGRLVGLFHGQMAVAAEQLGQLWPSLPSRMRAEMVMVRGVDSSRWNAYAGALNTMRSAWVSSVLASGLDPLLDAYCPGKAPRLMASDIVWWARQSGQELHEDTRMFAELPHPWDVISGKASQSRQAVLDAAASLSVDALKSGWVGPRAPEDREAPSAEPALVHGVIVSDPQLAATLRRCGVFSGKKLKNLELLTEAAAPAAAQTTEVHVLMWGDQYGDEGSGHRFVAAYLDRQQAEQALAAAEQQELDEQQAARDSGVYRDSGDYHLESVPLRDAVTQPVATPSR